MNTQAADVAARHIHHAATPGSSLDIGRLLDEGPFTALQRAVVILAALSIVMDGFDGQLIGFAIPAMMQEWGISRDAFAPVVAAGMIGMGIGSACAGILADRFGRRSATIISVVVFGAATCAIGLSPNVWTIAALRFIAGLGVGGALPSSTTMTAEFTPARYRTVAITATIVCVPMGGMLAGLFATEFLPHFGWRGLFFFGGAMPLVLSIALMLALPESPRFLARRSQRWPELTRLLKRMGRQLPTNARYTDETEQENQQRQGFRALLAPKQLRNTLAIWLAFFSALLAGYAAVSWLPSMLSSHGLSISLASSGLTAYNFGGVVGALVCATIINKLGSRVTFALFCLGGALSAFSLQAVNIVDNTRMLIIGFGVHGLFVNAVLCTMYALCAHVYPTSVRATGTAAGLVFGRLGAVASAYAGPWAISLSGANGYLTLLGTAMLVTMAALLSVNRHIPSLRRADPPQRIEQWLAPSHAQVDQEMK